MIIHPMRVPIDIDQSRWRKFTLLSPWLPADIDGACQSGVAAGLEAII
jgi:hypothetical protein